LFGITEVGSRGRHGQLTRLEAQLQRHVALGQLTDTTGYLEELRPVEPNVMLEGLREELAVVRELPVDQDGVQFHPTEPEDGLAALQDYLDLIGLLRGDDPAQLRESPGRDVGLE